MIEIFLKILICSALAYIFYRFLLSKILTIKESRTFLLFIPIVILISAFIDFGAFDNSIINGGFLPTINVEDKLVPINDNSYFNFSMIYSIGFVLSMSYVLIGFLRIKKIKSESELIGNDRTIKIYKTKINSCFSFLRSVFLPAENNSKESYLLNHEKNHILKKHYLDLLYYNVLSILMWFNPFIFMLLRELKIVHELDADEGELKNFKETIFINKNIEFNQNLINGFSLRTYKRRLAMYNKRKINGIIKSAVLILLLATLNIPTAMLGEDNNTNNNDEIIQPGYKGNLMEELTSKLKYPKNAKSQNVEGTVMLKLVISKEGSLDDVIIEKSIGYGCDEEAVRVANTLKNWEPGTVNGKAAKMEVFLPVKFKLNKKEEK